MQERAGYRPQSLDELQGVVAWAVGEDKTVEVVGNGSKRGFGRPVEAEVTLATSGLNGVDMYEPEELVMSAGAGTPLREIEAMLQERQQELAFEPADYGVTLGGEAGQQTIGGVFAANLAGPRRLKAGAARDHLLGLQCVTGHGQIIKTGGRVVKNVTGYDLPKLLAGSFGTLAVLGRVTFKVLPAAEDTVTLLLAGPDEDGLLKALRDAMKTSYEVSSAALVPAEAARRSGVKQVAGAGRALACLRFEGATPSVRYRTERLGALLTEGGRLEASEIDRAGSQQLWRELRDVTLLDPKKPHLWRISTAPTAAGTVAAAARELGGEVLFDWAGGLVWVALGELPDAGARALRATVAKVGGHATLIRAPESLRATVSPFQPQPPALQDLSERVKKSFDPKGLLNPGRMAMAF